MPTKIEYVTETWNPVTGCTPVSEGCTNCYAERAAANRLAGRYGYPPKPYHFKVTLHPDRLEQPLKWRKPRRIFVCSMGDLFHEDVKRDFIYDVYVAMKNAPQHIFLILTKRPAQMKHWVDTVRPRSWPLSNVWLGVTAENQARADERIPVLLSIPAAVRFVSIEPMLGPVDLGYTFAPAYIEAGGKPALDWVILGAETGPSRRAMLPRWARDVKEQCVAAGVPFFLKQMYRNDGTLWRLPELDGRVWNEYPEVACEEMS